MVWWLFKKNNAVDNLKKDVENGLNTIKNDVKKAGDWITHLHSKTSTHEERLSTIEQELLEIKTFISFFGSRMSKQLSKHPQTLFDKHTAVGGVQPPVQTLVQTTFLGNLTMNERVIVWVLLNTDMKLSCEDIAALLNKDRSTVRGQLNTIKQKSEGIVEEIIEKTGKKRYCIPSGVKDMLLKKSGLLKEQTKKRKVKSED